ncbi:hypothetical protein [Streptomyces antibioticus]|uniref:hypothetical protein n=1 Tax=Streptomyces antibioticus TaxID=1890 RepID=UPI0033A329FE
MCVERDGAGAEAAARQDADHGHVALGHLAEIRHRAGGGAGAETLARQAADRGNTLAPFFLAKLREEEAEDRDGSEAGQAVRRSNIDALVEQAQVREEAGDRTGAADLYRRAADQGTVYNQQRYLWPYGLDPDGTPILPWQE